MAADTLVPGIPFPVTAAAAVYFNSLPADRQAQIRAAPIGDQRAIMAYYDALSTRIGDKTYQDTQAHQHSSLGPFDFSHTPLSGAAGTVNDVAGAVTTTGDFLSALTRQATWIRIAEAVVGAALVVVALNIVARPAVKGS